MTSPYGQYNIHLHRFTVITAILTFILIFIGGLVKSTESGLSVPDWPTTYGENMFLFSPEKMVGGILYEHGHRLFASLVGAMILIQAVWIKLKEKRIWVKKIAIITLFLVIIQGLLGGLTVKFLLPVWISSTHATLAQMILCLTVLLAISSSCQWIQSSISSIPSKLFYVSIFLTILIWIQLMIGAIMRHSEAGLAAFDFPTMYGEIIPDFSNSHLYDEIRNQFIWDNIDSSDKNFEHREFLDEHLESLTPFKIFIHFLHRLGAGLVFLFTIFNLFIIIKEKNIPNFLKVTSVTIMIFVILQGILGLFTIWSLREIYITTSHVANGAFILSLCFFQSVWLWKMKRK